MVSTRRGTKSREVIQEVVSSGDCGEDYERSGPASSRSPKSKPSIKPISKQKGKQPGGRRNVGKLSRLPIIPLDVLYEIFHLVHPADLLRMSWTNKAFHSTLTSKSSRRIWVAAFDNIPEAQRPPPCPEGLTEIGYANLLYNPCCMGCGARRAPAYWAALVRFCNGCLKNRVTIAYGVEDLAVSVLALDRLHYASHVLPEVYVNLTPSLQRRHHMFTKDLEQLVADLKASDDKPTVVQRYSCKMIVKHEFAYVMERLEEREKADRAAARAAARDGRLDQILERLVAEGWGEDISSRRKDYVKSITKVNGVKAGRPLTEKEWEGMTVGILEAMRTCKEEIENRAENKALEARCISRVNRMRVVVDKYQRTLHPHDFCPTMEDVCRTPDIRKAIIGGTDEEFNVCAEETTSRLPELTSKILEERTTKLSALLPFNGGPADVLSLATAWFTCGSCNLIATPMHSADVLRHQGPPLKQSPEESIGISEATFNYHVPVRCWYTETSKFEFSEVASTIARGLILDCGEDPESITLAEINSKFHRSVFYENGELIAHNWEETFKHKCHNPSAYHRFLGPDECPECVHDPDAYSKGTLWNCLPCWRSGNRVFRVASFATLPTVKQHITDMHGIDAPAEGVNYYHYHRHRPPKFVRVNQASTPTNPL